MESGREDQGVEERTGLNIIRIPSAFVMEQCLIPREHKYSSNV